MTQHRWIVDPLDGTTNFLHGIPIFSDLDRAGAAGEIVAGVMYNPAMDELYTAERGGGAFLNERVRACACRAAPSCPTR
jgi:myo-inositol-1(or 4)-monophosphatase